MAQANTLILDIETVGEDFDKLDHTTQENLTRWIKKDSEHEEGYKLALQDIKNELGLSPLTGEIVAIGVLDYHKNEGGVYYQAPGQKNEEIKEDGVSLKQMDEEEILRKFWELAARYEVFVTFNGRSFDIPYLMIRSAIKGVRPTKDLMQARYPWQQRSNVAVHVDLLDVLTFYGAVRRKGSLHLWSRAFGIQSPKSGGVTGDDVGPLFKKKKFLDIARYNIGDIRATRELYAKWEQYLSF